MVATQTSRHKTPEEQLTRSQKLARSVSADTKRQAQRHREEQRQEFDARYDDVVADPFPAASEVSDYRHCYIPTLDLLHQRGPLSPKALAVYVAMATRADFKEDAPFQVSQDSLSKLAGLNRRTVAAAVAELESTTLTLPDGNTRRLLERDKVGDVRRVWVYRLYVVRPQDRQVMTGFQLRLQASLVDSGVWARCSRRAQAFYLSARTLARADPIDHQSVTGENIANHEEWGVDPALYGQRRFDTCSNSLRDVCGLAGLSREKASAPADELVERGLVTRQRSCLHVYLAPQAHQPPHQHDPDEG